MWSPNLSKTLRMDVQPLVKFRQFADVKDAAVQGKKKGDSFHWNRYSDVQAQGTTLVETTTMPETNFVITQGTMTITEGGNSVPYTEKLDNLSEHPVKEIIAKVLKNDAKKFFDIAAEAQFRATPMRFIAAAGTATNAVTLYTNGTVTGTASVGLHRDHIKAIVDTMKERNVPPYVNDDYVAWPSTLRPLKNSLEDVNKYVDSGVRMIMNGEVGRYENTRFVEQTNIAKGTRVSTTTGWMYIFGDDTVAEGIVVPEEMRGKIPTDFGRSRGIAWYYVGGFGIVHTDASQARIFRWDSL
jgi:N4-gp56 family major capsid protein